MLLDKQQAGIYNQAIMDFGATAACREPQCASCVQQPDCLAWQIRLTGQLPSKKKSITRRQTMPVLFYRWKHPTTKLYPERNSKDIWTGLYNLFFSRPRTIWPFSHPAIGICPATL